jgi:hypothetical protein
VICSLHLSRNTDEHYCQVLFNQLVTTQPLMQHPLVEQLWAALDQFQQVRPNIYIVCPTLLLFVSQLLSVQYSCSIKHKLEKESMLCNFKYVLIHKLPSFGIHAANHALSN